MQSILVVEDDDELRRQICDVLEHDGFRTLPARNGAEALDLLATGELPGLIILDLIMPIMNGWAFRARQEADPRLAAIPVLVMTAVPRLEDAAITASDFVTKPVSIHKLLERVRAHLLGGEFDGAADTVTNGVVGAPLELDDSSPTGG